MTEEEFQTTVLQNLQELKTDVQVLKTDVQVLKEDQKELKSDFHELKHDLYRKIDRLEDSQREDKSMIMDLWKSREKVIAQVTWDFMWKATAVNTVLLIMMFLVLKV